MMSGDWSRYEGIIVDPSSGRLTSSGDLAVSGVLQKASLINQKMAITYRDSMIANVLEGLGVTRFIDIGCDFGSLLFESKTLGIKGIGLDPNAQAIRLCRQAGLEAIQGRYQDFDDQKSPVRRTLLNFLDDAEGRTAVSLLNILHQEKSSSPLWEWLGQNWDIADYWIVTAHRRQLRLLGERGLKIHSTLSEKGPIWLWQAHLSQYGRTFFSKDTAADVLEEKFWQFIRGRHAFPDKLSTYHRLVVLLKRVKTG